MLPKHHRLPGNTRFHKAQVIKTPLFSLRVQSNSLESSRFGFVVSKKVDKRAVVRNRLKRVFRSCIEEKLSQIKPGNDMLFILSPTLLTISREEMKEELAKIFSSLRLI